MLSVLLFQSVGYVVFYKYLIKKHRHDIKTSILRELPDEALTIIRVPLADPGSVPLEFEHAEEFKLNGEMYDIVRSEIRNDTIYYVVFHDKKETSLYRSLTTAVNQRSSHDQASNQRALQLFSIGQCQYLPIGEAREVFHVRSVPIVECGNYRIIENPAAVHTPPPKPSFT